MIKMVLPLCRQCGRQSTYLYHDGCPVGGSSPLQINPSSESVYCPDCGQRWAIYKNCYRCECGGKTSTDDILYGSRQIMRQSRQLDQEERIRLAKYVERQEETKHQIDILRRKSAKDYFEQFCRFVRDVLVEILGTFILEHWEEIKKIAIIVASFFGLHY